MTFPGSKTSLMFYVAMDMFHKVMFSFGIPSWRFSVDLNIEPEADLTKLLFPFLSSSFQILYSAYFSKSSLILNLFHLNGKVRKVYE